MPDVLLPGDLVIENEYISKAELERMDTSQREVLKWDEEK